MVNIFVLLCSIDPVAPDEPLDAKKLDEPKELTGTDACRNTYLGALSQLSSKLWYDLHDDYDEALVFHWFSVVFTSAYGWAKDVTVIPISWARPF